MIMLMIVVKQISEDALTVSQANNSYLVYEGLFMAAGSTDRCNKCVKSSDTSVNSQFEYQGQGLFSEFGRYRTSCNDHMVPWA